MKKLLLALLISTQLNATVLHEDKAMHMMVGGAIYFGCIFINREILEEQFDEKYCLIPPLVAIIYRQEA